MVTAQGRSKSATFTQFESPYHYDILLVIGCNSCDLNSISPRFQDITLGSKLKNPRPRFSPPIDETPFKSRCKVYPAKAKTFSYCK